MGCGGLDNCSATTLTHKFLSTLFFSIFSTLCVDTRGAEPKNLNLELKILCTCVGGHLYSITMLLHCSLAIKLTTMHLQSFFR